MTTANIQSTTVPPTYKLGENKYREDEYSALASNHYELDQIKTGTIRIGKTTLPIAPRVGSKMPTLWEMLKFWSSFNEVRYNQIIERHKITT